MSWLGAFVNIILLPLVGNRRIFTIYLFIYFLLENLLHFFKEGESGPSLLFNRIVL